MPEVQAPCFLKRGRRSKLDDDEESRLQRSKRTTLPPSPKKSLDPLGDQNEPAAVWLSLQGKLRVYVKVLTSEEPDEF